MMMASFSDDNNHNGSKKGKHCTKSPFYCSNYSYESLGNEVRDGYGFKILRLLTSVSLQQINSTLVGSYKKITYTTQVLSLTSKNI